MRRSDSAVIAGPASARRTVYTDDEASGRTQPSTVRVAGRAPVASAMGRWPPDTRSARPRRPSVARRVPGSLKLRDASSLPPFGFFVVGGLVAGTGAGAVVPP